MVIKTLIALGTSFDCASRVRLIIDDFNSQGEIQMVLDQGVAPTNIIYANPCKQASHLRFASSVGVQKMTFDNVDELHKIKQFCPEAQLVLRILTDDSKSLCKLGTKFGASQGMVRVLLETAKELAMNVIGIRYVITWSDLQFPCRKWML